MIRSCRPAAAALALLIPLWAAAGDPPPSDPPASDSNAATHAPARLGVPQPANPIPAPAIVSQPLPPVTAPPPSQQPVIAHTPPVPHPAPAKAQPVSSGSRMEMDRPVLLPSGITAVCTGIGEAKDDPRWKAYPIRVEFSNGAQQYLAGAHVELRNGSGVALADVNCSGAWVLFQLPAGDYHVNASLLYHKEAPNVGAKFSPPATGQKRVVLEYKGVNAND